MSLSIDAIVPLTLLVSPNPASAPGFNIGLLIGSNALPLEQRIKSYTRITDVAVDFASNTPEYQFAQRFFGQSPAPQKLLIGNRFTAAQAGRLRGGSGLSAVVGNYTGITNGGFDVTVNGTLIQVTGLNLSAAGSMAAIATAIQTKLNAGLAGTTCTWDPVGQKFVITSPTTGTASIVGLAVTPTGGGAPTDNSATFGFTQASGAISVPGIAAESMTDTWNASKRFDAEWYGMALTSTASTQDNKDSMAYAESTSAMFFCTTMDPNTKLSVSTTDLGYYASNLGYNNTTVQYSSTDPNAVALLMARMFVVDYSQPNSTITAKFKQEPGIAPEPLQQSDVDALTAKHVNYYVARGAQGGGSLVMIEEGVVASGRFLDEVINLAWLHAQVQTDVFNFLATRVTKVPQTDAGVAMIVQQIEKSLSKGVTNGFLAEQIWNGDGFGSLKNGDLVRGGFYVYGAPVSSQSLSDRAARKSPPIQFAITGAGAIHSVPITGIFQR